MRITVTTRTGITYSGTRNEVIDALESLIIAKVNTMDLERGKPEATQAAYERAVKDIVAILGLRDVWDPEGDGPCGTFLF